MRAHQIMTKDVITVTPHTSVLDAAKIMLRCHVSGLPVLDDTGALKGIVSEGDFLRRSEIGTGRKRSSWLEFFTGPGPLGWRLCPRSWTQGGGRDDPEPRYRR